MVEQLFGVRSFGYTVYILSCVREEKKKEKKKNKIETFMFDFLACEKSKWNSESIFYIRIAKGFNL